MFVGALELWWRLSLVLVAGIAAGVANGIAGGGTFITFPTLLALGVPALRANLSTTVGVLPSYLGSLRVFRTQIAPLRRLIAQLLPSCVLGAAAGATLLLAGSPTTFRLVVPWLIGAGTALFAVSPIITRRLAHIDHGHRSRRWALFIGVFVVSIYGGYFGAGLGILLLAVMAVALPLEIKELQGLRNAVSIVINATAAVIFIFHGHLATSDVVMLLIGTLIGGYLGALLILRLSPVVVRALVITIGVITTVKLAIGS
ncbi:MAG: sulfite exporter TauE/SafE family protein [Acidimicrobiales bacterium]